MIDERRVTIIAEAGVNHNGDPALAHRLVDAAVAAGADMVKFQTFNADQQVTAMADKAAYQKATTDAAESQRDMLRRLELDEATHGALKRHCAERGIAFLSTPFDVGSLRFLIDRLGLDTLKIPSGEITDAPLLLAAGRSGAKIILSTGMSTLDEVRAALAVLGFAMICPGETPTPGRLDRVMDDPAARRALAERVALLHCTTEYPAPFEDANLCAMATMRTAFGLPIGLSDHTPGIAVPIAAVALGACIVEKHFTLDRTLPGPDHRASLEPGELAAMVQGVRAIERALGSADKRPAPSEIKNMAAARKSLVALRPIRKGERFTADNLGAKRPGGGISPMAYWDWLGRGATRDYAADEAVDQEPAA